MSEPLPPPPTNLTIRPMAAHEVSIAVDWAAAEGWNPGLSDAETFFQADPTGFFVGEVDGEVVAVGSAVAYDEAFAFCGLYIVAPEARGKGYGLALTQARLAYCGDRTVGIDGVLENVEIYGRIGYQAFYQNARYQVTAGAAPARPAEVRDLATVEAAALRAYDRQCFPAARDAFLAAWTQQPGALALAWVEAGALRGYAVRRPCREGHKVGPLFADTPAIAEALFAACQTDIAGEALILDVPENNPEATRLAQAHAMERTFATARMYRGGLPDLAYDKIFGITTFELG